MKKLSLNVRAEEETSPEPSLRARLQRLSATRPVEAPVAPTAEGNAAATSGQPGHENPTADAPTSGVGSAASTAQQTRLETELAETQKQLSDMIAEGRRLASAREIERADYEQRLQTLLTEHRAELQAAHQREQDLAAAQQQVSRQQGADRDGLQAELERTRIECQRLAVLAADYENERHAVEQRQQDIEQRRQEMVLERQTLLIQHQADREAWQADLQRTAQDQQAAAARSAEVAGLEQRVAALTMQIETERQSADQAAKRFQLDETRQRQALLKTHRAEREAMQAELARGTADRQRLEAECQTLRAEREQVETSQAELERAKADRQRLEAECQTLRAKHEQVETSQAELERAKADRQRLEAECQTLRAEREQVETSQAELERAKADRQRLEAECQTLRAEREQVETSHAELERAKADRQRLEAECQTLRASWRAERSALEDRQQTLVARYLDELQAARQSLDDQLKAVLDQHRAYTTAVEAERTVARAALAKASAERERLDALMMQVRAEQSLDEVADDRLDKPTAEAPRRPRKLIALATRRADPDVETELADLLREADAPSAAALKHDVA